jgi:hypothetical protein
MRRLHAMVSSIRICANTLIKFANLASQQLNNRWVRETKQECMCKIFFNYRDFNALEQHTPPIRDLVTTRDSHILGPSYV